MTKIPKSKRRKYEMNTNGLKFRYCENQQNFKKPPKFLKLFNNFKTKCDDF